MALIVTPHVLQHTTALGHESIEATLKYLDANLALKEKAGL
ncbi:MAG: hypothetical protein ACT6S0_18625 [Roseateles sp.]